MTARKPVTSLTLTEPQLEWLRAEAARLGISQSDVVRRIVDFARANALQGRLHVPDAPGPARTKKP